MKARPGRKANRQIAKPALPRSHPAVPSWKSEVAHGLPLRVREGEAAVAPTFHGDPPSVDELFAALGLD